MKKEKILIIDDEPGILKLVESYLRPEGFDILTASDGVQGLQAARTFKPDLIVLDIMLPGIDGLELLSQLRRESNVYVILLTAKTEETDKIVGLSVGADDYLTKPFSPRELVARIKAALRRINSPDTSKQRNVLTFKHIRIDVDSRKVWEDERLIELTSTEFDILRAFAENHGIVISREQLLEKIWGFDYFGEIRVIDVHVGHLRQKLHNHGLIQTVRSVGYRFEDSE